MVHIKEFFFHFVSGVMAFMTTHILAGHAYMVHEEIQKSGLIAELRTQLPHCFEN